MSLYLFYSLIIFRPEARCLCITDVLVSQRSPTAIPERSLLVWKATLYLYCQVLLLMWEEELANVICVFWKKGHYSLVYLWVGRAESSPSAHPFHPLVTVKQLLDNFEVCHKWPSHQSPVNDWRHKPLIGKQCGPPDSFPLHDCWSGNKTTFNFRIISWNPPLNNINNSRSVIINSHCVTLGWIN